MNTRIKIFIAILVVVVSVAVSILVVLGRISVEPVVGLFGVITGALISEFSHHQSAREERRHQLRLAALDRRLQAHQEAFSLWRRIMNDMSDPMKLSQTVMDCQEWWNNNCLYLDPDARQSFSQAYLSASTYPTLLRSRETKLLSHEMEVIREAGNKIVQGVELPTISEGEEKYIHQESKSDT